ncbi:MAG: recombination regulator RecX [Alphaproteobacteria bacterium]|nr:recombination regulator RecX [Alphaproteobacteria bacterium]
MSYENYPETEQPKRKRPAKKITPQRLKNIGLYYLKRFESSVENLRSVLQKRVNQYAKENPDFNKQEAYQWVEDVLTEFEKLHYLDDKRFTEIKVRSYLAAGKPARYIQNKLREKGIANAQIEDMLDDFGYNPQEMALKLAKRKKIGPFRPDEESRKINRQKDMAALIRAGFDYDVVAEIMGADFIDDGTDDDL